MELNFHDLTDGCKILSQLYSICILWITAHTDLCTHISPPPFWRWVRTRDPPACVEPVAGSKTAQPNSWASSASITPLLWLRKCWFFAQVRREGQSTTLRPVITFYCLLLPIIDLQESPENRSPAFFCPHFVYWRSESIIRRNLQFKYSIPVVHYYMIITHYCNISTK